MMFERSTAVNDFDPSKNITAVVITLFVKLILSFPFVFYLHFYDVFLSIKQFPVIVYTRSSDPNLSIFIDK